MSSLAASRADGYYFPPEWRPEFGGLSKYQGSKGANQYQQYGIIRFELPFDGWCLKCERHIGKGTRFNAKKDKAGKYFSTQIYSFTFKCASCDNEIIIKTDPQNNTYDYTQGIRAMEQDFTPDVGDSLIEAVSDEQRNKLQNDPMYQLQHEKEDKEKARTVKDQLTGLIELSEATSRADYDANSMLRRKNRSGRKRARELLAEGGLRGLSIPLVEPSEEDTVGAKEAMRSLKKQSGSRSAFAVSERVKRTQIMSSSIFDKLPASSRSSMSTENRKRSFRGKVSSASISSSPCLSSSAARSHRTRVAALQKAAERNITARGMKVTERPILQQDVKPVVSVSFCRVTKDDIAKGMVDSGQTTGLCVDKNIGALDMLSGYSDGEEL